MFVLKRVVLLFSVLVSLGGATNVVAQNNTSGKTISDISDDGDSVRIIDPKKEVPVAKSAAIDTEKFELGLFTGFLAVEDFNSNLSYGLSFSYHITPAFLAQINYGESEVDRATFEDVANANFLSDADRTFEYYNILAGYRILRGRSFFGANKKYNSDVYLLAGVGKVDFAGDSNSSIVVGTSYRVVLTDALVANFDIRGHSVKRNFLDDDKRTFNAEYVFGLNFLF
ncbi:MAG: outer membrane beta-barrel domain-containing protein [Cellvibrionaceae bacterium]